MRAIPDNNLAYPVLIERSNGGGSGFYFNTPAATFLATAKHVLFNEKGQLKDSAVRLRSYASDLVSPLIIDANLDELRDAGHVLSHAVADVVVIAMGARAQGAYTMNRGLTLVGDLPAGGGTPGAPSAEFCRYADVLISNDIYLFGYPNSIGHEQQIDRSRPLLRKGIVAGKNDINATIIVDCPVYRGSSGGLVLQLETMLVGRKKLRTIGIVTGMVPFIEKSRSLEYGTLNTNIENSGYTAVEPVDRIFDLIGNPTEAAAPRRHELPS